MKRSPLLLVIDGHSMVFRAWFAIREKLRTPGGTDVSGAYGFLNILLKVVRDHNPTHVAVAFDTKAPTFRDKLYPGYKAQRPPLHPDLLAQIPIVKTLLRAFKIPVYETDGYEADDLVGTIAGIAGEKSVPTLILSGDADQLQLVSDNVRMLMYSGFGNAKVYNVAKVQEKYDGLGPEFVAQIKALEGDKSDNIPGVPGVGPKAARPLLKRFGGLNALLERIDEIPEVEGIRGAKRVRDKIAEHKDSIPLWWKLTEIDRKAPTDFDLDASEFWKYERAEVVDILMEHEFRSIIGQLPNKGGTPSERASVVDAKPAQGSFDYEDLRESEVKRTILECEIVNDSAGLAALLEALQSSGSREGFAFDTETDGLHPALSTIVGISFALRAGHGWYVPLNHKEREQLPLAEAIGALKPLFEDTAIPKTAHNANFDMTVMLGVGVEVRGEIFDTMVAAALCGYKAYGLKQLALNLFREEMTQISELIGKGRNQKTMGDVPISDAAPYAAADAEMAWRMRDLLKGKLERHNQRKVFYEIESPLLPVIVKMQHNGMLVDVDMLRALSANLSEELKQIEQASESVLGKPIRLTSTRELAQVLIEELGAPKTRKTKNGWSMDANALEGLLHKSDLDERVYQLADAALRHRQLMKLKTTYSDSLQGLVSPKDGRVHTAFNQVGSATGRLSSSDPNIQNIPVRTTLGNKVRKAFTTDSEGGWSLLSADYSQIELRVLAHLSQEPALVKAFRDNEDIHAATARTMYNTETVSAAQRRVAKILNFGVIYGLGPHGVARQTDLSREQGKEFIELYFGKYPGIKNFIEEAKHQAKTRGYAETLCGRRRYLPEIEGGGALAAAAERVAVNMPIQGTAADIIKIAMVLIDKEMNGRGSSSKMVAQVHDELIFEVALDEMEVMREMITRIMPSALNLSIPLEVELKEGRAWGDMS